VAGRATLGASNQKCSAAVSGAMKRRPNEAVAAFDTDKLSVNRVLGRYAHGRWSGSREEVSFVHQLRYSNDGVCHGALCKVGGCGPPCGHGQSTVGREVLGRDGDGGDRVSVGIGAEFGSKHEAFDARPAALLGRGEGTSTNCFGAARPRGRSRGTCPLTRLKLVTTVLFGHVARPQLLADSNWGGGGEGGRPSPYWLRSFCQEVAPFLVQKARQCSSLCAFAINDDELDTLFPPFTISGFAIVFSQRFL